MCSLSLSHLRVARSPPLLFLCPEHRMRPLPPRCLGSFHAYVDFPWTCVKILTFSFNLSLLI